MRLALLLAGVAAIVGCGSEENPDDYIVFANGSKVKKTEITEGFHEGCIGNAGEMPEYLNASKYCDCMLDQILNNSDRIDIDVDSDNEDAIVESTMEYFTNEGMDMVVACLQGAIDESLFDWDSQRDAFMGECLPYSTDDANYPQMEGYCNCVWEQIRDNVAVNDVIDPAFAESEQLAGYIADCAAEFEIELPE
jgi:hypothetical protein